jgi:hypothetical protein
MADEQAFWPAGVGNKPAEQLDQTVAAIKKKAASATMELAAQARDDGRRQENSGARPTHAADNSMDGTEFEDFVNEDGQKEKGGEQLWQEGDGGQRH